MLNIVGITLSLYAAVLLLKNVRIASHRILIALAFLWAIKFGLYALKNSSLINQFPIIILIDQTLTFLDAPLIWWYVRSVNGKKIWQYKYLWHLLPFGLMLTNTIRTYLILGDERLLESFKHMSSIMASQRPSFNVAEGISMVLYLVSLVIYNLLSIREVNHYHQKIKKTLSNIEKVRMKWLKRLLTTWTLLVALPTLIYFLNYLLNLGIPIPFLLLILTVNTFLFLSIVGYFGSEQQYLSPVLPDKTNLPTTTQEKYKKSGLSAADLQQLYEQLVDKITTQQLYLRPELTLSELADELHIKPYILSQVINEGANQNFYDFINHYRVEAVKELLANTQENILQIAFQCGFKSKSTFNACFKKFTGYTPSQYRKS